MQRSKKKAKADARKKRDSAISKEETTLPPKKLRSVPATNDDTDTAQNKNGKNLGETCHEETNGFEDSLSDFPSHGDLRARHWDLETALHRLVPVGHRSPSLDDITKGEASNNDAQTFAEGLIERLSPTTSLHFRLGHGGDASTIAELYRQSLGDRVPGGDLVNAENDTVSAAREGGTTAEAATAIDDLEVWLTDAMGNEDVPPSAFVLIAEMRNAVAECTKDEDSQGDDLKHLDDHSSPDQALIVALAILTQLWERGARMLQVEWLFVRRDHELSGLVERRLWLRLSTLAVMTHSDGLIVKESVKNDSGTIDQDKATGTATR